MEHFKIHPFSLVLLWIGIIVFDVTILDVIEQTLEVRTFFSYDVTFTNFRNQEITLEDINTLMEESDDSKEDFDELLTMYYANDNKQKERKEIETQLSYVKEYQRESFEQLVSAVQAVWSDVEIFPVGEISSDPAASVFFANSWMQSRTYGGERGHEGTDIMASVNQRGIYPIYSMTDGVVEKIGWLPQGGYRIGIRSPSGGYFYYAHLAEYAKDFCVGEQVSAGTLLGMMGDTGYSEIEGTTGNFDVHLHLGIYVTIEGEEYSVNSYPVLLYLAQECDVVKQ